MPKARLKFRVVQISVGVGRWEGMVRLGGWLDGEASTDMYLYLYVVRVTMRRLYEWLTDTLI